MPRYILGDRRNDLRVQLRLQAAYERRLQSDMAVELKRVVENAADQLESSGDAQIGDDHRARVMRMLEASYEVTMPAFGQRILDAASDKRYLWRRVKQGEDEFERAMRVWIRNVSAVKVTQISETTRQQIRDKIEAGRKAGLGTEGIAKALRGDMVITSAVRAHIIARTETHAAAQAGNRQAAKATGIAGLEKEWLAAEDSRTREDHNAADGQTVDQDASFTVGGVQMEQPGDPNAPAAQVVNCRCALAFITPE